MMLMGLWCGRRRVWEDGRWRRAMWLLGGCGLVANGVYLHVRAHAAQTASAVPDLWQAAALSLAGPFLVLAGVSLFYGVLRQRLLWLAPVGRMAFSNYIGQSILCSWLFTGYGLGWYGHVDALGQLGLVTGIFLTQVLVSHVWLQRFRFGPLEWLWRAATYGAPYYSSKRKPTDSLT